MKRPVQRMNVDFTVEMLHELDQFAAELNISRQAVTKTYLRQSLDQLNLAESTHFDRTTIVIRVDIKRSPAP